MHCIIIVIVVINDALSQIFECPVLSGALAYFSFSDAESTSHSLGEHTHFTMSCVCFVFVLLFFLAKTIK